MSKIKSATPVKKSSVSKFTDTWTKTNWIVFGAGFVILALGFILMSFSPFDNPISLSVSPVVILLAYLVIFPLAILFKPKETKSNDIS